MMRRIFAVGAAVAACAVLTACLVGAAQSAAAPAAKHAHPAKKADPAKRGRPSNHTPDVLGQHDLVRGLGASDDLTPQVLFDCSSSRSGFLTHRYSVRVLVRAQHEIPIDVANYTNCPQAIRRQVINATARISVSIHRTRKGPAVAGRVVVRYLDQREVDGRSVSARQAVDFGVVPGIYIVRADGQPRCTTRVRASAWRTTNVRLVCKR